MASISLNPSNWFSMPSLSMPSLSMPSPPSWMSFGTPAARPVALDKTSNTLGQIGVLGSFFGAVNSTIGTYYSAKSQASALEHQAAMAEINARISETGAQSALLAGQKQVGQLTLKVGKLRSAQKTALAANGVVLGEGNAAELIASTDILKEIDANQIMANAVQQAWGYRTQAVNFTNQALTQAATASSISPMGMAAGSLLGGAGTVAAGWYSFRKQGGIMPWERR